MLFYFFSLSFPFWYIVKLLNWETFLVFVWPREAESKEHPCSHVILCMGPGNERQMKPTDRVNKYCRWCDSRLKCSIMYQREREMRMTYCPFRNTSILTKLTKWLMPIKPPVALCIWYVIALHLVSLILHLDWLEMYKRWEKRWHLWINNHTPSDTHFHSLGVTVSEVTSSILLRLLSVSQRHIFIILQLFTKIN